MHQSSYNRLSDNMIALFIFLSLLVVYVVSYCTLQGPHFLLQLDHEVMCSQLLFGSSEQTHFISKVFTLMWIHSMARFHKRVLI